MIMKKIKKVFINLLINWFIPFFILGLYIVFCLVLHFYLGINIYFTLFMIVPISFMWCLLFGIER